MKFIDAVWFSSATTVGIVLCEDENLNVVKCYIGCGLSGNEQSDIKSIMDYGSKIPKAMAESVFGELPNYVI